MLAFKAQCLWGVSLCAALSLLLSVACTRESPSASEQPALEPLPSPSLEGMERDVRVQIEAARTHLEQLRSAAADTPALAEAFARLGEIYHAYLLNDAARAAYHDALLLNPRDLDTAYLLAVLEQSGGDLERSRDLLERVVAQRPKAPAPLLRLGDVLLELGLADQARESFVRAQDAGARAAGAAGEGRALLELDRPQAAVARLQQALEWEPGASSLHRHLARAYRRLGQPEQARAELERQGLVEPRVDDPLLARLQQQGVGIGIQLRQGDAALLSGHPEAAVARYRSAVEAAPDNVEALQSLAAAQARAGDLDGSRATLERALGKAPESVPIRLNLAALLLQLGDPQQALPLVERAAALDPKSPEPQQALAMALEQLGRSQQALAARKRAAELDPTAESSLQLANFYARNQDYESALPLFRKALESTPNDVSVRLRLVTVLALGGREGEAIHSLEAALDPTPPAPPTADADPERQELEHALARLLASARDPALRDPQRALTLAERVFDARPTIGRMETVGMALAAAGRYRQAAEWQEKLLQRAADTLPPEALARLQGNLTRYRAGLPATAAQSP